MIAVSPPTLFACLDRSRTATGARSRIDLTELIKRFGNNPVPLDQVIDTGLGRGVNVDPVRLNWQTLQSTIGQHDVLLILKNFNVVSAIGNNGDDGDKILVSDPLYQDGNPFLLPRDVLEDVLERKRPCCQKRFKTSEVFHT